MKLFFLSLFACVALFADVTHLDKGPVHEAFVTPAPATPLLQAVAKEPPPPIVERIPDAPNSDAKWIPGYWAFSREKEDFVWVCGVFRNPPPGLQWNSGYWKRVDQGFVYFPGFWHQLPAQSVTAIAKAPPAPITEDNQKAPSSSTFWMSGYWSYQNGNYLWVKGKFEPLDPKWEFHPAYYVYRESGYLFVPAYWDLPLDKRGNAYCSLFIDEGARPGFVYTPSVILTSEILIESLFPCWPDNIYFFHFWWWQHPVFWGDFCCTPPWWGWGGGWWWVDPFHAWDLWWWWGNPGFGFPWWLPVAFADFFFAPGDPLFLMMQHAASPPFIFKGKIYSPNDILAKTPILPVDPSAIFDSLTPQTGDDQRPKGDKGTKGPERPSLDNSTVPYAPGVIVTPPRPSPPNLLPPPPRPQYEDNTPPSATPPLPQYVPPHNFPRPLPMPPPRPPKPAPSPWDQLPRPGNGPLPPKPPQTGPSETAPSSRGPTYIPDTSPNWNPPRTFVPKPLPQPRTNG